MIYLIQNLGLYSQQNEYSDNERYDISNIYAFV